MYTDHGGSTTTATTTTAICGSVENTPTDDTAEAERRYVAHALASCGLTADQLAAIGGGLATALYHDHLNTAPMSAARAYRQGVTLSLVPAVADAQLTVYAREMRERGDRSCARTQCRCA